LKSSKQIQSWLELTYVQKRYYELNKLKSTKSYVVNSAVIAGYCGFAVYYNAISVLPAAKTISVVLDSHERGMKNLKRQQRKSCNSSRWAKHYAFHFF